MVSCISRTKLTIFCQHILWAEYLNDRKSTSGYISMLSGGAASWKSRKQTSVSLSTAEAKHVCWQILHTKSDEAVNGKS